MGAPQARWSRACQRNERANSDLREPIFVKILGISGLDRSVSFKRAHWPDLEEREYRMSQGHDAAAALLVDGEVVAAAAEERFNGRKHSGAFPAGAIGYCLAEAGIGLADVDEIVHGFDYSPYRAAFSMDPATAEQYRHVFSKEALLELVRHHLPDFALERVHQVSHHLAHAASAYFTSGWDQCLVLVVDGMGEVDSATVYTGRDGQVETVQRISAHDSIGVLYSLVTFHLGFDFNADEYKIMGLAPYGDPERFRDFFEAAVELRDDGTIRIPVLRLNRGRHERENYLATRHILAERLGAARSPDSEVTDAHRDIAAALQACLDRVMLHMCDRFATRTAQRRLALAGGVALNCTANGRLLASGRFDDLYIQPAAADDGTALGAALYRASVHGEARNARFAVPFLGPGYAPPAVEAALTRVADRVTVTRFPSDAEACGEAARFIAEGRVVGWFRGRMEFGPRALGHRSILADPGDPAMRDRVNAMVKKREAFRPFAPAVTREEVHRWFAVPERTTLPYMITIVEVREPHRAALPAITHVDGTARVQTVSREDDPAFHRLLQEVGRRTGRQMVLNTSFNVKGQPIVNTPLEAVETFLGTGIDCLFLENVLVQRRS
jgi:carbamoyltransferase